MNQQTEIDMICEMLDAGGLLAYREPEDGEFADEIEEGYLQEIEDMDLDDTSYYGWPVNL